MADKGGHSTPPKTPKAEKIDENRITIIYIYIYTLSDLGNSNNLIGSLSRTMTF